MYTGRENRDYLYFAGKSTADTFCKMNGFVVPTIKRKNMLGLYGMCFYRDEKTRIAINVDYCNLPCQRVGFDKNWPGAPNDLTPYGIVLHEIGHYIHFREEDDDKLLAYVRARASESKINTASKCVREDFAEAVRILISNPLLLKEGRPKRYKVLTEVFGLKTFRSNGWEANFTCMPKRLLWDVKGWVQWPIWDAKEK